MLHGLNHVIKELIGDTRVMFATKKHTSIGSTMVQNKQLSIKHNTIDSQKCNARGCRQCPLVNKDNKLTINGKTIMVPQNLNCKSKNIIYLWLCKLCHEAEAYFGRTIQECHNRTSGHRGCFNSEDKWENRLCRCTPEMYTKGTFLWTYSMSPWSKKFPHNN